MNNDAISSSVYGGLTSRDSIEILIYYIFQNIDSPIKKENIIKSLSYEYIANYFELETAFNSLVEKDYLTVIDDMYRITDNKNNKIFENLYYQISDIIKVRALKVTKDTIAKEKKKNYTNTLIKPNDSGYDVICEIIDNNIKLFSFTMYAPNMELAYTIKDNFDTKADIIYKNIINEINNN